MKTHSNDFCDSFGHVSLRHLRLSEKYDKLLRYLLRLNAQNEGAFVFQTIRDLLTADLDEVRSIRGIGQGYVDSLQLLQMDLPALTGEVKLACERHAQAARNSNVAEWVSLDQMPGLAVPLSTLSVNLSNFAGGERKVLEKIERTFGRTDVWFLLSLEKSQLTEQGSFGRPKLLVFLEIQARLANCLYNAYETGRPLSYEDKGPITLTSRVHIDFATADAILLDDIEEFLFVIPDNERELLLSRWGFHCEERTLEEIAVQFDLTRERIRQKEVKLLKQLRESLRVAPQVLLENVVQQNVMDIEATLPRLRSCFGSLRGFTDFLNLACAIEGANGFSFTIGEVKSSVLDTFFCTYLAPVQLRQLLDFLRDEYGYGDYHGYGSLKKLARRGELTLGIDSVSPTNLGRVEVAAQVLLAHPKGLPWKDVVALSNVSGLSRTPLEVNAQVPGSISDSKYLYLCARGTYRHIQFHHGEAFDVPVIMAEIFAYFNSNGVEAIHLHEFFRQATPALQAHDYFDFRECVRAKGQDYGLFFNGRSGVDGLGRNENFSKVTQQQVVLALVDESAGAVTIAEIAEKIPSKSSNFAKLLVGDLVERGCIVRVDNMMYTTPDKAFRDVDTAPILEQMDELLRSSCKIIECDIFREKINQVFSLPYSKYFYAGLAFVHLSKRGLNSRHNLLSYGTLQYSSLNEVFVKVCDPEMSNEEAIGRVGAIVLMTQQVANIAVANWRISRKPGTIAANGIVA